MNLSEALDMSLIEPDPRHTIAVSLLDTPDLRSLGMHEDFHLASIRSAAPEGFMSYGWGIAYCGEIRTLEDIDFYFNLLVRYRGYPDHPGLIGVSNYLSWPDHIRMPIAELDELVTNCGNIVNLVLLNLDGSRLAWEDRKQMISREPTEEEWSEGLTAMRRVVTRETCARMVLGGYAENFRGRLPRATEEALLSLQHNQPLYLLGGYGGCVRDITESLGLTERGHRSRQLWPGKELFSGYGPHSLMNGLDSETNRILSASPFAGTPVMTILRGLRHLRTAAKPEAA